MSTVLTRTVARFLLLPILMVAIATVIKGYSQTGDGFSGGVIAATAILLQYLAFGRRAVHHVLPPAVAPVAVLFGLLLALLVAFVPMLLGAPVLTHLPAPGQTVVTLGSLALHTAVLFDVAIFFLVFGFVTGVLDRFGAAAEEHPQ
jgi:multisubunit Na+/H+ antiporter MnhB subunit